MQVSTPATMRSRRPMNIGCGGKRSASPFERRYLCHYPFPIDEAKMNAFAPLIVGENDFTAFAAKDDREHKYCARKCGRFIRP